ncbi:MAG TPA: hypothetical protein ENJ45_00995, partial [Phaeodactylibacter sp.]|nr:hypothetical protein [Phaeodactylibacter sp.]
MRTNLSKTLTVRGFARFSPPVLISYTLIAGLYLLWICLAIGFRSDHALFFGGISILFFASAYTRKMVLAFGFIL